MNTAVATAPAKPVQRRVPPLSAVANRNMQQANDAETDRVALARLLDGHAASQMAFIACLLQDLGRLELHRRHAGLYAPLEALSGHALCDGEGRAFGQDHAAAGADLAEAWALPAAIVEAIAMHHRPVSQLPESPAAQAVWLASLTIDGAPGLEKMPLPGHIQTGRAQAQAACRREIESLCSAVGA